MTVCTKFHGNFCWNISVWTKVTALHILFKTVASWCSWFLAIFVWLAPQSNPSMCYVTTFLGVSIYLSVLLFETANTPCKDFGDIWTALLTSYLHYNTSESPKILFFFCMNWQAFFQFQQNQWPIMLGRNVCCQWRLCLRYLLQPLAPGHGTNKASYTRELKMCSSIVLLIKAHVIWWWWLGAWQALAWLTVGKTGAAVNKTTKIIAGL